MLSGFETATIEFVRGLFDAVGWLGIIVAMTIESAGIPLPSEVVMPLAGWLLVSDRHLGWPGILFAGFWGAVGNVVGSAIAYGIGAWGGRPLLMRYGRWVLITRKDLTRADRWFADHGEATAFFTRLLPVVRTFISFPAGITRMPLGRFLAFTFAGAFLWCVPLAAVGYYWGPKWEEFRAKAQFVDDALALLVLLVVAWYIWHKVRELRHERAEADESIAGLGRSSES